MAGLKKKKPEKSTSPNLVLIIFLVFFFLVTVGLGIWGYYGYAGQEDLRRGKLSADAAAKSEKSSRRYYYMLYQDLRTAFGEKLDEKESGQLNDSRDEFYKDENGGPFKDEADKKSAKDLMDDLHKRLGGDASKDYKADFRKELETAQAKAKESDAKALASASKVTYMEGLTKRLVAKQDAFHQETTERIGKDNAGQLAIVKQQTDSFQKVTENNRGLTEELKEKATEIEKLKDDHKDALKQKDRIIARLEADLKDKPGAAGAAAAARAPGEIMPLLLDIRTGRPLWDFQEIGKIIYIDKSDPFQVTINIGKSHGVVPETTFTIFGRPVAGEAAKRMKGSLEVIKVLDSNSSLARITSLRDEDDNDVDMRSERKVADALSLIRADDRLYNVFWGARVAIAGKVSLTGDSSDNPAEQMRQLEDFMNLLKRNGIQVDAYVDLKDGQVKGVVTSRTRYLITDGELRSGEAKAAPKAEVDKEKDKEKEEKEKEKEPVKEGVNAEHSQTIHRLSAGLFNEARERGMLIISADNFVNVIGYRRPRSAPVR